MKKTLALTLTSCLLLVAGLQQTCLACSVPVFRYALENWQPDPLTVVVLHRGQIPPEQSPLIERMEAAASEAEDVANLEVHTIDVEAEHPDGSPEATHAAAWKDQDKTLPQMLVYFASHTPRPPLAWSAPLTSDNVDRLLHSPARKDVVERLLDGQSAVWVLLKSGNAKADTAAEEELKQVLARQANEIELPTLTDLATEEKFNEDLSVEMRVEFSVIAIDADDQQETFFREMLLSTEPDLKDFVAPIAIPIYGRGRTYFALVGKGITAENISNSCNFICGACSCEVKRDNPGQDLLLAANWNRVQPGNWVNDTPLPELTGIGGFEGIVASETANENETASDTSSTEQPIASVTPESGHPSEQAGNVLVANVDHASRDVSSSALESQSGPTKSSPETESRSKDNSANATVMPVVLLWGVVLFGIGLVFTVWQRTQNRE